MLEITEPGVFKTASNMLFMYQEAPAYTQQRRQRRTSGSRMRLRDILATPGFVPLLVVLFVGTFAQRSYQPLIPLFVASAGAAPGTVASVTGMIVAGGALAATLSATLASRLVVSFPHARVLVVALSACACGSGCSSAVTRRCSSGCSAWPSASLMAAFLRCRMAWGRR